MSGQMLVPVDDVAGVIFTVRGKPVILDSDLARLYGVPTMRLNEQVKRNRERFPVDFMFQLTVDEVEFLISQNAISKAGRGGRRTLPYAFTEHGALMAATVLNSPQAVAVSVYVIRAFVQQRALLAAHGELALKMAELEKKVLAGLQLVREHDDQLTAHEAQLEAIVEAIRELQAPPTTPRREIGFRTEEEPGEYTVTDHKL